MLIFIPLALILAMGGCADLDEPLDRDFEADDARLDDEDLELLAWPQGEAPPEGEEPDGPVRVGEIAVDVDGNGVLDKVDGLIASNEPVAIGELACATTSIADPTNGASVAMTQAPNCGYSWDGSTSPNTSYDPVGCPHQYVTQVNGTSGEALSFYWSWEGANLDQSNCSLAHASLSAYGAYISWPWTTNWVKLGTSSVHGVWVDGPLFDFCSWQYDAGSGPLPSLGAGHGYYKVRTAAQATGFIFKQKVEGGVVHGPGPC